MIAEPPPALSYRLPHGHENPWQSSGHPYIRIGARMVPAPGNEK
jgi:hypothetical protein